MRRVATEDENISRNYAAKCEVYRARRIAEIDEALARPVESDREWDTRRARLQAELEILRR